MEDRPTLARLLGVVRKNPGFRRLFAANAVSQMGDWFNVVALFSPSWQSSAATPRSSATRPRSSAPRCSCAACQRVGPNGSTRERCRAPSRRRRPIRSAGSICWGSPTSARAPGTSRGTRAGGAGIAMLWTARGIGSFLGPFVAFRLAGHDERGLRRGILWSFLALVVCYSGFAASPGLWSAAGFLAVANAAGSTLWTYGSALLQQIVPDEVRGRVAATEMGGMVLTMSSSTWLIGHLLDRGIGPRTLMAACGLVALVPAAFWASAQGAFRREEPRDTAASVATGSSQMTTVHETLAFISHCWLLPPAYPPE